MFAQQLRTLPNALGLTDQRVARLRPAETLPPQRDTPRQLGRAGVQSADGDAGPRQRGRIHGCGALILHQATEDEAPRPGRLVVPPKVREVARPELVTAQVVIRRRGDEADLAEVNVSRRESGPPLPEEDREARRRLADASRTADEQDIADLGRGRW